MKLGDSGAAVKVLQGELIALGYQVLRDGDYGPKTCAAIKQFQAHAGILVDGEAGPHTLLAIAKARAPHPVATTPSVKSKAWGIDCSAWQPGTKWSVVKDAGASFAFIKATEGLTYTSPLFESDYRKAREAGLIVGSYHFYRPGKSPEEQAEHYLKSLGEVYEAGDLPPVLDLEIMGVARATLRAEALTFLKSIERGHGVRPILYTNPAMLTFLGDCSPFADYPLWLAAPEVKACPLIKPWGANYAFWQYSFKQKTPGTTGLDANYFNGSVEDLQAFARGEPSAPPPNAAPAAPELKLAPPAPDQPLASAPWMGWMKAHLGLNEAHNSREIADLVWPHTNYTTGQNAHTVIGDKFAWCAATVCAALENSGFKSNKSASAQSYENFGQPCEFKFGAILPIRHANGTFHATFFDHWVDENKKLAACLGGNQTDAIKVSIFNLSGNQNRSDQVVPSPRWPVVKL